MTEQEKAFEEAFMARQQLSRHTGDRETAKAWFLSGYAAGERAARHECAETVSENDICNICNELLAHWAEQNKPHLDDEEKCCYVLAVRAADEIRRLRAEVDALRGVHEAATRVFKFHAVNKRNFFMAFCDLENELNRVAEIDAARKGE